MEYTFELLWQCQDIVTLLDTIANPSFSFLPLYAQPIHWCPMEKDITLEELFMDIGTSLAAALEAKLT